MSDFGITIMTFHIQNNLLIKRTKTESFINFVSFSVEVDGVTVILSRLAMNP